MPVPMKKDTILSMSAKEKVYKEVSGWIVNGTLQPGEKINESEISEYFSVSRTPVREALQQLAEQKLIHVVPSRGSFVSPLTRESGDAIYEALAEVSASIAALACRKRTDAQLKELRRLADIFADTYRKKRYELLPEKDNEFHNCLAKIAGNEYLSAYAAGLQLHTSRFEYLLIANKQERDVSIEQHAALINAVALRDETAARQIAADNWMRIYREQIRERL